jgi:hypothetical protein
MTDFKWSGSNENPERVINQGMYDNIMSDPAIHPRAKRLIRKANRADPGNKFVLSCLHQLHARRSLSDAQLRALDGVEGFYERKFNNVNWNSEYNRGGYD